MFWFTVINTHSSLANNFFPYNVFYMRTRILVPLVNLDFSYAVKLFLLSHIKSITEVFYKQFYNFPMKKLRKLQTLTSNCYKCKPI